MRPFSAVHVEILGGLHGGGDRLGQGQLVLRGQLGEHGRPPHGISLSKATLLPCFRIGKSRLGRVGQGHDGAWGIERRGATQAVTLVRIAG